jgi:iron complex outermembrane receptor protein
MLEAQIKSTIDTFTLTAKGLNQNRGFKTLAQLKQETDAKVYILDNGNLSLSTLRYKGLSPENSQILWNGFTLNSFQNGVFDLNQLLTNSKLLLSSHDNIWGNGLTMNQIDNDASSNFIDLSWSTFQVFQIRSNYQFDINEKWHLKLTYQSINGDNNYRFFDEKTNKEQIENHAKITSFNPALHSFWTLNPKAKLHTGAWYQHHSYNIPLGNGQFAQKSNISNNNVRTFVNLYLGKNQNTTIGLAYFNEFQNYFSEFGNSQHHNHTIQQNLSHQSNTYKIDKENSISWHYQHNIAVFKTISTDLNDSNFNTQYFNRFGLKIQTNSPLSVNLALKNSGQNQNIHFLMPDLSAQYQWNQSITTSINYNQNRRFATNNDRHYTFGGNTNINPEFSHNFSLYNKASFNSIIIENELYYISSENLIRWAPTASGIWRPQNLSETKNWGANLKVIYKHNFSKLLDLELMTDYNYNQHIFDGKDLNYNPNSKWINAVSLHHQKAGDLKFELLYVSSRQTNSEPLPAYTLCHVNYLKSFLANKLTLGLEVRNVFDANYREFEGFPLPLRQFMILGRFNF